VSRTRPRESDRPVWVGHSCPTPLTFIAHSSQLPLPVSNPVSSLSRSPKANERGTLCCVCIITNASRIMFRTGGPLKPDFGLSGNAFPSPQLCHSDRSRPPQKRWPAKWRNLLLLFVRRLDVRRRRFEMANGNVTIIVALAGCFSLAAAQGRATLPFSLLLAAQPIVQAGSPAMVELTTTNNLSTPLRLGKTNPGMEYQIQVWDENVHPVNQTPLYKELQNPGYVFRSTSLILKPHESSRVIRCCTFFRLQQAGQISHSVAKAITKTIWKRCREVQSSGCDCPTMSNVMWRAAHPSHACTTTTEAAPPFAVFKGWEPRTPAP
jgi:hypothetical protein